MTNSQNFLEKFRLSKAQRVKLMQSEMSSVVTTTTTLPLCSPTTVSGTSSSTYINATESTIFSSGLPVSTSTGAASCQIPTTTSTVTDTAPIMTAESTDVAQGGGAVAVETSSASQQRGRGPVTTVWETQYTTMTAVIVPSTVVVVETSTITERPTAAFLPSRSAFAA